MSLPPLADAVVPSGMRSRFVPDINALRMHVLEAGFEECGRPLVLLLHGFPELAYSWRKVMLPLAAGASMSSRPISGAMAARSGGMRIMTAISARFAF
jgi:pimeloyl-ACP methyl ester carboxylesterase